MRFVTASRLLLPLSLALLAACSSKPTSMSVTQEQESDCPLQLDVGQMIDIMLPSNPTTGFRWVTVQAAENVLQSMGPETYTNPENAGMVGSAGQSSWRFKAYQAGEGKLLLQYQRPWEQGVAPAKTFACVISVN